jgi:hypothetical protein
MRNLFEPILEKHNAIKTKMEKHGLRNWLNITLSIIGGLLWALSGPLLFVSLMGSFMGHVSFDPPTQVQPVYDAGFGFIFNRWFWRCMLGTSILMVIASWQCHPATIVERKISREALANYRAEHGWPWN